MHELISCSVYVCASALLLPLVHVSLFPLYLFMHQPSREGHPPLPIRDVHGD